MRQIDIKVLEKGAYFEFVISCKKYDFEDGVYRAYLGDKEKYMPLCVLLPSSDNFYGNKKISKTELMKNGFFGDMPTYGFISDIHEDFLCENTYENVVNVLDKIKKEASLTLICDFNKHKPCPLLFIACKCKIKNRQIMFNFK